MMITIKNDGTIEPLGLKFLRESNLQLMAPTRNITDSSDEFNGEIDFGTELKCGNWVLVGATDEGLTATEKMQARRNVATFLNNLRNNNGGYLTYESDPDKKIRINIDGRTEIEEYPSWLKVHIPLRVGPFWISTEEKCAINIKNIRGGNYVKSNETGILPFDEVCLSLTGGNCRVMRLPISPFSEPWQYKENWPTKDELSGDDWTTLKRIQQTYYWTSTEYSTTGAYAVNPSGDITVYAKTGYCYYRSCYTLSEDIWVVGGNGSEGNPYILVQSNNLCNGTHETPIIIELKGPDINPEIIIGNETLKYFGTLLAEDMLTVNTEHGTVKFNGVNALGNYVGGFPQIQPGGTIVEYSGDGVLTIRWHDCWI